MPHRAPPEDAPDRSLARRVGLHGPPAAGGTRRGAASDVELRLDSQHANVHALGVRPAPARRVRPMRTRRRLAANLAFVALFFTGASFSAFAEDNVADLLQDDGSETLAVVEHRVPSGQHVEEFGRRPPRPSRPLPLRSPRRPRPHRARGSRSRGGAGRGTGDGGRARRGRGSRSRGGRRWWL